MQDKTRVALFVRSLMRIRHRPQPSAVFSSLCLHLFNLKYKFGDAGIQSYCAWLAYPKGLLDLTGQA